MIKICSLDFINKETFEADIMTADGRVLFYSTDVITPEKILKLYFKDIYTEKPLVERIVKSKEPAGEQLLKELNSITPVNETAEAETAGPKLAEIDDDAAAVAKAKAKALEYAAATATAEKPAEVEYDDSGDPLEFDEEEAKRVVEHSLAIAKELKFSEDRLKELEQAAYYHNIGVTKFTKGDLAQKDFRQRQALAGYEILKDEKKLSKSIAETAKYCVDNYNGYSFKLTDEIPYYHIVAIASYYDRLINHGFTKSDALAKMLRLGGNKFNVHVLHRFNNIMKDTNG